MPGSDLGQSVLLLTAVSGGTVRMRGLQHQPRKVQDTAPIKKSSYLEPRLDLNAVWGDLTYERGGTKFIPMGSTGY